MTDPIVFSAEQPLIVRAKQPQGFTLETQRGVVIYDCNVPYHTARFHLTPGPMAATTALTIDLTWFEV